MDKNPLLGFWPLHPFVVMGYFIVQLSSLLRGPVTKSCKELFKILSHCSMFCMCVANNVMWGLFFWSVKKCKFLFLKYKGTGLYGAIKNGVVISPNFS